MIGRYVVRIALTVGVLFTLPAVPIEGQSAGVWTRVSTGINFSAGPSNDNFGVQDIVADPTNPARLYVTTCYDGLWWSQDYGRTWSKRSTGGGPLDYGKNWTLAIAPDMSAMYTGSGNNPGTAGGGITWVYKSTDGGVTWRATGNMGAEPYSIDIDRTNYQHLVASAHENGNLYESFNGGQSWTTVSNTGANQSAYAWFLSSTRVLLVSDGDNGVGGRGTRLGIFTGGAWTWTKVAPPGNCTANDWSGCSQQHYHGFHQIVIDETVSPRRIYNPGAFGIHVSTDEGATWTRVATGDSSVMVATGTRLYSGRSYPMLPPAGYSPNFRTAARSTGTSWDGPSNPSGMTNGPKRFAAVCDGTNWIVLTSNWREGLWRYIEPGTTCSNNNQVVPAPPTGVRIVRLEPSTMPLTTAPAKQG